ncbi:dihydrodiol dehydrogenase [Streptomyces sp. NPDC048297]|uniref:dihydrodiol dehydrogenase n=1 Tax=Streptomyces sp. NPDC048297 TaxID=3365531 RepID=UPI003710D837
MDRPSNEPTVERPDIGDVSAYPDRPGGDGPIVIANEFADVIIRKVQTRNGVRLDIWSPRRGSRVLLDAVALDCLSFQEPDFITDMLARRPAP